VLHVFHDATLERMCGITGALDSFTAKELETAFLPNGFPIPKLADVLAIMGDLPVLIELKVDAPGGELAERVADLIDGQPGRMAVMSFDEPTVARLCQLVTGRPVGLLIAAEPLLGVEIVAAKAAKARAMGCDYLAPHLTSLATVGGLAGGLPLVTWTLRDPADLELAQKYAAAPIFEGFSPSSVPGLAKPGGTPI
jgi:glycerophosphoryl diester phosphodiesterase